MQTYRLDETRWHKPSCLVQHPPLLLSMSSISPYTSLPRRRNYAQLKLITGPGEHHEANILEREALCPLIRCMAYHQLLTTYPPYVCIFTTSTLHPHQIGPIMHPEAFHDTNSPEPEGISPLVWYVACHYHPTTPIPYPRILLPPHCTHCRIGLITHPGALHDLNLPEREDLCPLVLYVACRHCPTTLTPYPHVPLRPHCTHHQISPITHPGAFHDTNVLE